MRLRRLAWVLLLLPAGLAAQTRSLALRIPMAQAGEPGLEALLVEPTGAGRHPLVLLTHGSAYGRGANRALKSTILAPQAGWFAQNGWAVLIVLRRGYGSSGGRMEKDHFRCDVPSLQAIADEDALDLAAAYAAAVLRPEIDTGTVLAVGNSAGAFAALAYAASPGAPPGLRAVINVSGGWRRRWFAGRCARKAMIPAFATLGAAVRVPTLWLYAANDSVFPPAAVAAMHAAFTGAGGAAELPPLPRSRDEGHYLFAESPQLWMPAMATFLAAHNLPH